MCGFAAELKFDGQAADIAAVNAMVQTLARRGPDGEGLFAQGPRAFAQRRLKIMDLSEHAQQPMFDPLLGLGVVFNGAIYNHPELRAELRSKGYQFYSEGDTEVILKAYHAWGKDCVKHFQGMFAFVLWERDSGRTVLARDRLGIKPMYLHASGKRLRAASTLPALLAGGGVSHDIDPVALHRYLSFHAVVPPPHTILKDVRKLPPATVRVIEADGSQQDHQYWSLSYARSQAEEDRSFEDWKAELLAALRLAVKRRLVADVPVGALLSGGVDSSLIVGLQAEAGATPHTFSIGFDDAGGEAGNEFKYSDVIVERFATQHEKIHIDSQQLLQRLPEAVNAMAEPMVSHDCIGFFLLSEAVSKHAKVVQSGQGADEVFGGYHWYPPMMESSDRVNDYFKVFADRDDAEMRQLLSPDYHDGEHSRSFVAQQFAQGDTRSGVDQALRMDTTVMLVDDPVKRVDNMTMAWGLEARVPFLDHELVEVAAKIPARHKIAEGGKYILKEAAREVVPAAVIDRPKGYFPVPALKYITGPVLDYVQDTLHAQAARERGLFQAPYVQKLLKSPADHITPLGGSKLWQLGLLEGWLQAQLPG